MTCRDIGKIGTTAGLGCVSEGIVVAGWIGDVGTVLCNDGVGVDARFTELCLGIAVAIAVLAEFGVGVLSQFLGEHVAQQGDGAAHGQGDAQVNEEGIFSCAFFCAGKEAVVAVGQVGLKADHRFPEIAKCKPDIHLKAIGAGEIRIK